MNNNSNYARHTYSYLALRRFVGLIGILLPFVLIGGALLFNEKLIQESISHYYHTSMRDVFVGALCAVALFMFFYSGYDWRDNWAGHFAGIFALGVAWFPVTEIGKATGAGVIHLIFAALFFLTLAVFSLCLFTLGEEEPTTQKSIRNKIYVFCGLVIALCIIAISIYHSISDGDDSESSFVFWVETIALVVFGFSWLTKGEAIFPDPDS